MVNPTEMISPRQEIVSLLRGYVACPLLSCLGESGLLDRMLEGPITAADVSPDQSHVAEAVLRYLWSLGLIAPLQSCETTFETTRLGQSVFQRGGAFNLLHSYHDYFENLSGLLTGTANRPVVNRARNVLGSGRLHVRKYFPLALQLINEPLDLIVDVGCGNGEFLAAVLDRHPKACAVAIDLSPEAVSTTVKRLGSRIVADVTEDGARVSDWASQVPPSDGRVIISAWFVIHEFASSQVEPVVRFFRDLHTYFPHAEIIVGEIVNAEPEVLSANRANSVMPEFMLFHALSGQGVLSWDQYQQALSSIPYRLIREERFDSLAVEEGVSIPSGFLWHLSPDHKK